MNFFQGVKTKKSKRNGQLLKSHQLKTFGHFDLGWILGKLTFWRLTISPSKAKLFQLSSSRFLIKLYPILDPKNFWKMLFLPDWYFPILLLLQLLRSLRRIYTKRSFIRFVFITLCSVANASYKCHAFSGLWSYSKFVLKSCKSLSKTAYIRCMHGKIRPIYLDMKHWQKGRGIQQFLRSISCA